MFQLLRYKKNGATGEVDCMIEYDKHDGKMNRVSEMLLNDEVASNWVINSMTKYILEKLRRYIDHKKVLMEVSPLWSAPETEDYKKRSLSICQWNLDHLQGYPLDLVCMTVLSLQVDLKNILPLPAQESYKGSVERLNSILATCTDYVSSLKLRQKHETA